MPVDTVHEPDNSNSNSEQVSVDNYATYESVVAPLTPTKQNRTVVAPPIEIPTTLVSGDTSLTNVIPDVIKDGVEVIDVKALSKGDKHKLPKGGIPLKDSEKKW